MFTGANVSLFEWARFIVFTTVGNVIGGVVFMALLNYSHVIRGSEEIDIDA